MKTKWECVTVNNLTSSSLFNDKYQKNAYLFNKTALSSPYFHEMLYTVFTNSPVKEGAVEDMKGGGVRSLALPLQGGKGERKSFFSVLAVHRTKKRIHNKKKSTYISKKYLHERLKVFKISDHYNRQFS